MRSKRLHILITICLLLIAGSQQAKAQDRFADDSLNVTKFDSLSVVVDTTFSKKKKTEQDWSTWRPDPKRALWLALVIPGGGQIYNRKYWKLPLVYGGFIGCMYAMNWNNTMYKDYSQAYIDLMDNDPSTQSYNQFLHLGSKVTPQNEERYKAIFKRRKDYYRRWRDMSFFIMLGIYAVSVLDAYIDASLSDFDISKDISMKVAPAVINSNTDRNPLRSNALGLQCSLTF